MNGSSRIRLYSRRTGEIWQVMAAASPSKSRSWLVNEADDEPLNFFVDEFKSCLAMLA